MSKIINLEVTFLILLMLVKNRNIAIAVLPFQVVSNDSRIAALFNGFTEDIITSFSKFIGLSVISSFSTNRIKDISNHEEIDKLGADYFVFGSVREHQSKLRISIQLIKNEDQSIVFGNQYDESLDALLETQDAIVHQITTVLEEKINYNLLSYSYKKNSVDLAAYENYLMGMHTLKKGSGDNDIKSRAFFYAALEINPNYSLAYTGLSLSYFNFWSCLLWDRWDENMKGAHKYALKAIELDEDDYTALGILGRTFVYLGEYEKAEHYLRKSLRMNPNDCSNMLRVAFSFMFLGYTNEALKLYHKSIGLNPFHSNHYYAHGAIYYLEIGDFNKSIELAKKAPIDHWTDFPAFIASAYLQTEELELMWQYWDVYLDLFRREAYSGKKNLEEEALEWLLVVNPFKNTSSLHKLIDYIKTEKRISKSEKSITKGENSFHLTGDVWEIYFKNTSIILKDAKGLHDIHKLLKQPNETHHCLDLMRSGVDESNTTIVFDKKAKTEYQNRIKILQIELEEAENHNQIERISSLREEYDGILDHLSQSLGLAGKTRKVGSTLEKARSAVTWRIRNSIKKIETNHPELAKHLSKSIKTGTFCVYSPEVNTNWTL